MPQYLYLSNPGHNRVYYDSSQEIAISELRAFSEAYQYGMQQLKTGSDILPSSISFVTQYPLDENQLKILGTSSGFFCLFEQVDKDLLRPVTVPDFRVFPESMIQILKYTGKTNEQFTRLMVNLASCACQTNSIKKTLFDPMCGKGTTLYEGLIRGFHVNGIEWNATWVREMQTYLLRFLKEGRYKHQTQRLMVKGQQGKKIADGFLISTAASKESYQNDETQSIKVFHTDTCNADQLLKKKSCDMMVCDLPYGVQHASKIHQNSEISRSPYQLLKAALPGWYLVLKQKGSIVLSFNEFTLTYDDVARLLENSGFSILIENAYSSYLHRVDQSIKRNLIVAVKS